MKRKINILVISVAVAFSLGGSAQVFACSCGSDRPVCEAFGRADAIFVGKVIGAKGQRKEKDENGKEATFASQETYLQVTEAFYGVENSGQVTLTDLQTTCDYPFQIGETYLVYAYGDKIKLQTSFCSRTRPISKAGEDLPALRKEVKDIAGTRMNGYVRAMGLLNLEPIAGEKIKLESVTGGSYAVETMTDNNGAYSFRGVPAGKYKILFTVPKLMVLNEGEDDEIDISGKGCAIQSFTIFNDSSFTGRLMDEAGHPVPSAEVEFIPVNNNFEIKDYEKLSAWGDITGDDGSFTFSRVPVGRYLLAVNFKNPPFKGAHFPTTFYPNSSSRSQATIFSVGLGQKMGGISFTVPSPLPAVKISGEVRRADGKAAVDLQLLLKDVGANHSAPIGFATLYDDGKFELLGYLGRKYVLEAKEFGADDSERPLAASPEFLLTEPVVNLKLVVKRTKTTSAGHAKSR